jgi:hypothetical protein
MRLLAAILLLALEIPAFAQNLVENGGFEKWTKEGEPEGWHTRITGVITVSEYEDPVKKKGLIRKWFKDGCGYDWGEIRPFPGLYCPQCKQMITTEESSDWYVKNVERVAPAPGKNGKGAGMKMDDFVGGNQGVRLSSDFIKAEDDAGYEWKLDVITGNGGAVQAFVEGFQYYEDPKVEAWLKTLPKEVNPFGFTKPIRRAFRSHLYLAGKTGDRQWKSFSEQFVNMKNPRYHIDLMYVNLYGYMPSAEMVWDNIVLRKLSAQELKAYHANNPPAKEERFR